MNKRYLLSTIASLAVAVSTVAGAVTDPQADRVTRVERMEAADEVPRSAFFVTDTATVDGEPGTLIRSEAFQGYELPQSVRATRILYRSRSELGHDTVASAVVIVPTQPAPKGGWPVLIWAHGTTGVAARCAPSLSKQLGYYTDTLVKEGLRRGFAVIAVDYSGLGAGNLHEYLWKEANANDVAFAAPAARAAEPLLATNWVAIGHSQGGQAVWGVAEKMATLHDPTYRGAVALAPAVDTDTLINHVATTADQTFYPVYVAFGIKAVYPEFDIHSMLLPTGLDAYPRLTSQGCWPLAEALFYPVKPGTVLNPKWVDLPQARQLFAHNQVGNQAIAGPMFVASGANDDAVPAPIIAARVKALCAKGATVSYKSYPGDHGTMMQSSFADQMSWIVDRFHGRAAPNNCQ